MSKGTFLMQGSNPCLLHWQADSLPPEPQGSLVACALREKTPSSGGARSSLVEG